LPHLVPTRRGKEKVHFGPYFLIFLRIQDFIVWTLRNPFQSLKKFYDFFSKEGVTEKDD